jgi:hypothetical protein
MTIAPDGPRIPLALLSARLAQRTGRPAPGYRSLPMAALDARLPAERVNGRWYVREADLDHVAEALGLAEPAAAASAPISSL